MYNPELIIENGAKPFPAEALANLELDTAAAGGAYESLAEKDGRIGVTMFDTPASDDETIAVLMHRDNIGRLPSQAAVRIASEDGHTYLGVVVKGPFALPDGLRADAPPIVATAIRGGDFFLPEYHGLVFVEIAGEEKNGQTQPHRFRPRPNSPVFPLSEAEVRTFLKTGGNITLGRAFGHDALEIAFQSSDKQVLPRHTGILGTTGGGKSTTVANLVSELQAADVAVILLDTEGEYTEMDAPTDKPQMQEILAELGQKPHGVPNTDVYHLVGRKPKNSFHDRLRAFSPRFANISPFTAIEIFDLNEAQEERFQRALNVTARALDDLKIWDEADHRFVKEEMDEFDEGYPKMRLSQIYDVTRCIADILQNGAISTQTAIKSAEFRNNDKFTTLIKEAAKDEAKRWDSWRKVQGKIGRIERLNLFDNAAAKELPYPQMLTAGRVSIIDLSDSDSTLVNNLIISDLLRGVQKAQESAYQWAIDMGSSPTPVVVIIEEAHEFLSAQRIAKMPTLHQQVERIAKRGRKRWLGLVFITQLPQHLPDAILGLVNNFILHKIGDANVVARLKRSVSGVDDALWNRLSRLAPGQAIVSLASLSRPMLTAMSPAPCKLGMTD